MERTVSDDIALTSGSNNPHTRSGISFDNLPPELRNMVYDALLATHSEPEYISLSFQTSEDDGPGKTLAAMVAFSKLHFAAFQEFLPMFLYKFSGCPHIHLGKYRPIGSMSSTKYHLKEAELFGSKVIANKESYQILIEARDVGSLMVSFLCPSVAGGSTFHMFKISVLDSRGAKVKFLPWNGYLVESFAAMLARDIERSVKACKCIALKELEAVRKALATYGLDIVDSI